MHIIRAVFHAGVLIPLHPINLPEDAPLTLAFISNDDVSAADLASLAERGGAFDFLTDPREDLYSLDDGGAF